jgi:hypothetical protein
MHDLPDHEDRGTLRLQRYDQPDAPVESRAPDSSRGVPWRPRWDCARRTCAGGVFYLSWSHEMNSLRGNVLITCLGSSQARRAIATPYSM